MAKTLLSMAGAAYAAPDLSKSALVMIDCQQEYTDHALALPNASSAVTEAGRVLNMVRKAGGHVIHVRHIGKPGGAFDPDHARGGFIPDCAPSDGEMVIGKELPNAFAGTNLEEALRALAPERVILVGFMTHMCISATARAALDLGFGPTVIVANACATRDLPHPTNPERTVGAAEIHEAELAALADRFAFVVPDASALDA